MATATPTGRPAASAGQALRPEGPKTRKKLLLIVAVVAVVVAGAGYWFLLRPAPVKSEPVPGEVVTLEPIQLNLAGGRYLKLGLALQLTAEVAEKADGSKALDAAIELFSGVPVARLASTEQRAELQLELQKELAEIYEGDVMDVYFTEFVTQ